MDAMLVTVVDGGRKLKITYIFTFQPNNVERQYSLRMNYYYYYHHPHSPTHMCVREKKNSQKMILFRYYRAES